MLYIDQEIKNWNLSLAKSIQYRLYIYQYYILSNPNESGASISFSLTLTGEIRPACLTRCAACLTALPPACHAAPPPYLFAFPLACLADSPSALPQPASLRCVATFIDFFKFKYSDLIVSVWIDFVSILNWVPA